MFYSWRETYYPTPGTGNYAFEPNTTLPPFNIFGSGSMVRGQLSVNSSGQVITVPTIPVAGMGGLFSGQFISQPLDVRNENG